MTEYQILYWRDIPVQIKLFGGKRPSSHPLPDRFQTWIDRIAMQEGLIGSDAYLDLWQWSEKQTREGDAEIVLQELLGEIEEEGDRILAAYKQK
jgi:hypothetical protein